MEGMGTLAADSRADFYLLDRVINVMPNGAVPYKLKGTVVGIHGGWRTWVHGVGAFEDGCSRTILAQLSAHYHASCMYV